MPVPAAVRTQPSPLVGGWLWLFCFQFFLAEQIARLGWTGHYSMTRDYISDLGMLQCGVSACSPLHWLMNSSFVLQGGLIFFGALRLRCVLPRSLWILFALAGIGVAVVGLAPEGTAFPLHLIGAAANFFGGNLGMVFLGLAMMRRPGPWKGWVTFIAGLVGLVGTIAIACSFSPKWAYLSWHAGWLAGWHAGWEAGTVERLAAYPLPLWLTWTGYRLIGPLGRFTGIDGNSKD